MHCSLDILSCAKGVIMKTRVAECEIPFANTSVKRAPLSVPGNKNEKMAIIYLIENFIKRIRFRIHHALTERILMF